MKQTFDIGKEINKANKAHLASQGIETPYYDKDKESYYQPKADPTPFDDSLRVEAADYISKYNLYAAHTPDRADEPGGWDLNKSVSIEQSRLQKLVGPYLKQYQYHIDALADANERSLHAFCACMERAARGGSLLELGEITLKLVNEACEEAIEKKFTKEVIRQCIENAEDNDSY